MINDDHLSLIQKSAFFNNSKPDAVVDAGLVVLGMLSYVHSKEAYQSIFKGLDKVLAKFINEISKSSSKLIQVRFSLFLGYFSDLLFQNDLGAFKSTFMFLYQNVNLIGEDEVIALQTIDTLKTIACDKELIDRFVNANLIPEMCQLIKQSILTIQH